MLLGGSRYLCCTWASVPGVGQQRGTARVLLPGPNPTVTKLATDGYTLVSEGKEPRTDLKEVKCLPRNPCPPAFVWSPLVLTRLPTQEKVLVPTKQTVTNARRSTVRDTSLTIHGRPSDLGRVRDRPGRSRDSSVDECRRFECGRVWTCSPEGLPGCLGRRVFNYCRPGTLRHGDSGLHPENNERWKIDRSQDSV